MTTISPVTINANELVSTLYPDVRDHLRQLAPFLDDHFGNHLADQSIRHGVHRLTTYRSHNGFLPKADTIFLARQMISVGFENFDTRGGGVNGVSGEILDVAQRIALDHITSYEMRNNIKITGQTP